MKFSFGIHHAQLIAENVMKPDVTKPQLGVLPFQLPDKIGTQPEGRMTGVDAEFPDFRQRFFDFRIYKQLFHCTLSFRGQLFQQKWCDNSMSLLLYSALRRLQAL